MNKTTNIDESTIVIAFPAASKNKYLFLTQVVIDKPPTQNFKVLPVVELPVAAAVSPSCAVSPADVSSAVPSAASPPVAKIELCES